MRLKKLSRKKLSSKRTLLRNKSRIVSGGRTLKKPKKLVDKKALSPEELARKHQYRVLRQAYLQAYPKCEVCVLRNSTQIHHKARRKGKNLHRFFLAVCCECHQWIHDNSDYARKLGYIFDFDPKAPTPE